MNRLISRRNLLRTTAIASIAATGIAGFGLFTKQGTQSFAQSANIPRNPLKIPVLDEGQVENGIRVYNLTMQNGWTEFFDGFQTATSGVNGAFLGPTLKLRDGESVSLNVTNEIGETSTLHWHGFHLPASQDGGPHQPVNHGETRASQFTVKQSAATLWYHPHLMGKTAEHVWRGMAGLAIITDEETDDLDFPQEYGVDDIPIVLQDRIFGSGASMNYSPSMHSIMMGYVGDIPLVNGTAVPFFEANSTLIRLRILNGSNASIYNLGLSDNQTFQQIASDGGLLPQPAPLNRLILSPGERAEIIIKTDANNPIMLQNFPQPNANDTGGQGMMERGRGGMGRGMMGQSMMGRGMMSTNQGAFDFLEIRPAPTLRVSKDIPSELVTITRLNEKDAVKTRILEFAMRMGPQVMMGLVDSHTINGKAMKMGRIDETVRMGDTEIWELRNNSPMPHPIHIHDVQFQILDRNGQIPNANEQGRKDTVLLMPGETVRIIMKFEDYRDPDSPYMYHCHILEHEDAGMMGQFVVV